METRAQTGFGWKDFYDSQGSGICPPSLRASVSLWIVPAADRFVGRIPVWISLPWTGSCPACLLPYRKIGRGLSECFHAVADVVRRQPCRSSLGYTDVFRFRGANTPTDTLPDPIPSFAWSSIPVRSTRWFVQPDELLQGQYIPLLRHQSAGSFCSPSVVHSRQDAIKRLETFTAYPGATDTWVRETLDEAFCAMLGADGVMYVAWGFGMYVQDFILFCSVRIS